MSLTTQFTTMLAMIVLGGWLGAALDTYGRFFKRPQRLSLFVFINDLLFWIVQALLFFYVLFLVNEGQLRFYIIIAILCGFAAYQSLLRGIYIKILDYFIEFIKKIYRVVQRLFVILILRPIKAGIHFLLVFILFVGKLFLQLFIFLGTMFTVIVFTPLRWMFLFLWKIMPNNVRIFFKNVEGYLWKKKNNFIKWWKKFRS